MTIIAVKDNVMAADSHSFAANLRQPLAPGFRKIVRAPDGSLVGAAGASVNAQAILAWVKAGMDWDKPPRFRTEGEDDETSCAWLWLRCDGSVWRYGQDMLGYVTSQPTFVGYENACVFAEGAMAAGADAAEAVRLTIEHHVWVGGEVQVERLGSPEPGGIREVIGKELAEMAAGLCGLIA